MLQYTIVSNSSQMIHIKKCIIHQMNQTQYHLSKQTSNQQSFTNLQKTKQKEVSCVSWFHIESNHAYCFITRFSLTNYYNFNFIFPVLQSQVYIFFFIELFLFFDQLIYLIFIFDYITKFYIKFTFFVLLLDQLDKFSIGKLNLLAFDLTLSHQIKTIKKQTLNPQNQPEQNVKQQKLTLSHQNNSWSQKLKSNCIQITPFTGKQIIHIGQYSDFWQFSLLHVGFSQAIKQKQSWMIQIINKPGKDHKICIGICLKSLMQKNNFNSQNIQWDEENLGIHLVCSDDSQLFYTNKKFADKVKSMTFDKHDIVKIDYDPILWRVVFSVYLCENKSKDENKKYFRFKQKYCINISKPPKGDAYYSCVGLKDGFGYGQSLSVKFLIPGDDTDRLSYSISGNRFWLK